MSSFLVYGAREKGVTHSLASPSLCQAYVYALQPVKLNALYMCDGEERGKNTFIHFT